MPMLIGPPPPAAPAHTPLDMRKQPLVKVMPFEKVEVPVPPATIFPFKARVPPGEVVPMPRR